MGNFETTKQAARAAQLTPPSGLGRHPRTRACRPRGEVTAERKVVLPDHSSATVANPPTTTRSVR